MPAIQPARLRQQAALLAEHFEQPAAFIRSLQHLLEYYADRAHRPGQVGQPGALITAFNVRPPVTRQILLELSSHAKTAPHKALDLCDALWAQPFLEYRQLAAGLLGRIDPPLLNETLLRVERWLPPGTDLQLMDLVLRNGLVGLRKSNPPQLLRQVEVWAERDMLHWRRLAVRALLPWVEEAPFELIPAFYRVIQPFCRQTPPGMRSDLVNVLVALAQRSPRETAYFFIQNLNVMDNPDIPWFARQTLPELPEDSQERLRIALRNFSSKNRK